MNKKKSVNLKQAYKFYKNSNIPFWFSKKSPLKQSQKNFAIVLFGVVFLLLFFSNQSFQNSVVNALGLDNRLQEVEDMDVYAGKTQTSQVVEVVDGDTVRLDTGQVVRYVNIDTPESKKPGVPVQCFAKEATDFNQSMVDQKQVWLRFAKDPIDRYDRLLALVFLTPNTSEVSQSINAQIVKQGYGRSSFYEPNTTYKKDFQAFEMEAKENKLGLWSVCPKPFLE